MSLQELNLSFILTNSLIYKGENYNDAFHRAILRTFQLCEAWDRTPDKWKLVFLSTTNIHILLYADIFKSEMTEYIFATYKAGSIFMQEAI